MTRIPAANPPATPPSWGPIGVDDWKQVEVEQGGSVDAVLQGLGIKPNDKLRAIVAQANDISDFRRIREGTKLWIPRPESVDEKRDAWTSAFNEFARDKMEVVERDRSQGRTARPSPTEPERAPAGAPRLATRDVVGAQRRAAAAAPAQAPADAPPAAAPPVAAPTPDARAAGEGAPAIAASPADAPASAPGQSPAAQQAGAPEPAKAAAGAAEPRGADRERFSALVTQARDLLRGKGKLDNQRLYDVLHELGARYSNQAVREAYDPADMTRLERDIHARLSGREALHATEYLRNEDGRVSKGIELFFAANNWRDSIRGSAGTAVRAFDAVVATITAEERAEINRTLWTRLRTGADLSTVTGVPSAAVRETDNSAPMPANRDPLTELIRGEFGDTPEASWRIAQTYRPQAVPMAVWRNAFDASQARGEDLLRHLENLSASEVAAVQSAFAALPPSVRSHAALAERAREVLSVAQVKRFDLLAAGTRDNADNMRRYLVASIVDRQTDGSLTQAEVTRLLSSYVRPISAGGPSWDQVTQSDARVETAVASKLGGANALIVRLLAADVALDSPRGLAERVREATTPERLLELLEGKTRAELQQVSDAFAALSGVAAPSGGVPAMVQHVQRVAGELHSGDRMVPSRAMAVVSAIQPKRYPEAYAATLHDADGRLSAAARAFYLLENPGALAAKPDVPGLVRLLDGLTPEQFQRLERDFPVLAAGVAEPAAGKGKAKTAGAVPTFRALLAERVGATDLRRIQSVIEMRVAGTDGALRGGTARDVGVAATGLAQRLETDLDMGFVSIFGSSVLERESVRERLREFKLTLRRIKDAADGRAAALQASGGAVQGSAPIALTDTERRDLAHAIDRLVSFRDAYVASGRADEETSRTAAIVVGAVAATWLTGGLLAPATTSIGTSIAVGSAATALGSSVAAGAVTAFSDADPRNPDTWLTALREGTLRGAPMALGGPAVRAVGAGLSRVPQLARLLTLENPGVVAQVATKLASVIGAGVVGGAAGGAASNLGDLRADTLGGALQEIVLDAKEGALYGAVFGLGGEALRGGFLALRAGAGQLRGTRIEPGLPAPAVDPALGAPPQPLLLTGPKGLPAPAQQAALSVEQPLLLTGPKPAAGAQGGVAAQGGTPGAGPGAGTAAGAGAGSGAAAGTGSSAAGAVDSARAAFKVPAARSDLKPLEAFKSWKDVSDFVNARPVYKDAVADATKRRVDLLRIRHDLQALEGAHGRPGRAIRQALDRQIDAAERDIIDAIKQRALALRSNPRTLNRFEDVGETLSEWINLRRALEAARLDGGAYREARDALRDALYRDGGLDELLARAVRQAATTSSAPPEAALAAFTRLRAEIPTLARANGMPGRAVAAGADPVHLPALTAAIDDALAGLQARVAALGSARAAHQASKPLVAPPPGAPGASLVARRADGAVDWDATRKAVQHVTDSPATALEHAGQRIRELNALKESVRGARSEPGTAGLAQLAAKKANTLGTQFLAAAREEVDRLRVLAATNPAGAREGLEALRKRVVETPELPSTVTRGLDRLIEETARAMR